MFILDSNIYIEGFNNSSFAAGWSFDSSLAQRAFFNDILIAVGAREIGATVMTKNLADFGLIARVLDVRFAPPWPRFTE